MTKLPRLFLGGIALQSLFSGSAHATVYRHISAESPACAVINDATTDAVTFRFLVLNDDTRGNPSAASVDIGGGNNTIKTEQYPISQG